MRWMAVGVIALLLVGACAAGAPSPTDTPRPTLGATVPELVAALEDGDAAVRLQAAQRLGAAGDMSAVPALTKAAIDVDSDVALAAIDALASIGGDAAVSALATLTTTHPGLLDDAGQERFEAAVAALARVGGALAIARLLELSVAQDVDWWRSDALDTAMGAFDSADVPALANALSHDDTVVRLKAIECLGTVGGPDAVDALVEQVGSKTTEVREAAIDALGEARDPKASATLAKALADDTVFAAASAALVKIHSGDATPLVAYLKSKSTVKVYLALIRIGQKDTESALVTALNKYGDKEMAVDYLNCGNATLEKAARAWASRHGYTVVTQPGGASVSWGEG